MNPIPRSESAVSEPEMARVQLRRRWELASVLNFFQVFEPVVIDGEMKVSAEEIETALISPNSFLAQLHIILLKGIPPATKILNGSDAWITVLCKKLAQWWMWVAEGDIPITVAKGEEIARYKELDPMTRLLLLKALCEIRAEQYDIVSFVNDALKNGSEVSTFRKNMIGGDGIELAYWLDGNALIGHRLYKEEIKIESNPTSKGKKSLPAVISNWETLATNLDEFRKVADKFSSSGNEVEVAVSKIIENDAIPILEKLQKKKDKALKQQLRQERIMGGFYNSGIARSCRSRTQVTYTFDAYDKAIDEAIQVTKKRKTTKEPSVDKKGDGKTSNNDPMEVSDSETDSGKDSVDTELTETDSESELHESPVESENDSEEDDAYNEDEISHKKQATKIQKQIQRHYGSRWSSRLAGNAIDSVPEKDIIAKKRSRQRPTRNSALESTMVLDSEEEQAPDSEESQ